VETLSKDGMITTKNKEKRINKTAGFKKNHIACVLAKDKMNAVMKEFVDSPIGAYRRNHDLPSS
jgi:hypothetical protein